jgi:hypothetical protein
MTEQAIAIYQSVVGTFFVDVIRILISVKVYLPL